MREKIKVGVTIILMLAISFSIVYLYVSGGEKENEERIATVLNDYKYSRGIINKKFSYKGHSVHIAYRINGVDYEAINGYDTSKGLNEGDSILFMYSTIHPEMIISEMENDFVFTRK